MVDLLNDNYELSVVMSECKQNIFDILSPIASKPSGFFWQKIL